MATNQNVELKEQLRKAKPGKATLRLIKGQAKRVFGKKGKAL